MFREGFLMAWQSLIANKLRTLLTMLGIIIGVGAVIALVSVGLGVQSQIQRNLSTLGTNLIIIHPGAPKTPGVRPPVGSYKTLKIADYEAIAKLNSVKAASPVDRTGYEVVYKNNNWSTSVSGVGANFQDIQTNTLASGSFISNQEVLRRERVAVIGDTVLKNLFPNDTDTPLGKYIRINNQPFRVIGVLKYQGASGFGSDPDDNIFIPYTTHLERMTGHNYVGAIFVVGKEDKNIDQLEADINNILRLRHHIPSNDEPDFHMTNLATVMEKVNETTSTLTLFLGAIAAISLLVGGIGIMNIMLVSVTERTREIGVRKALGATYRTIVTQFLIEAIVISLIGGFIGVVIGLLGSELIALLFKLETVVSIGTILISFGFSMMIGLIFGIYPARKAARLNPIDTLHYE